MVVIQLLDKVQNETAINFNPTTWNYSAVAGSSSDAGAPAALV